MQIVKVGFILVLLQTLTSAPSRTFVFSAHARTSRECSAASATRGTSWTGRGATVQVRSKTFRGLKLQTWVKCVIILDSNTCQFLEANFLKQWYQKKPVSFKRSMILQDKVPSHASQYSRDWLASRGYKDAPCSPDLRFEPNESSTHLRIDCAHLPWLFQLNLGTKKRRRRNRARLH